MLKLRDICFLHTITGPLWMLLSTFYQYGNWIWEVWSDLLEVTQASKKHRKPSYDCSVNVFCPYWISQIPNHKTRLHSFSNPTIDLHFCMQTSFTREWQVDMGDPKQSIFLQVVFPKNLYWTYLSTTLFNLRCFIIIMELPLCWDWWVDDALKPYVDFDVIISLLTLQLKPSPENLCL